MNYEETIAYIHSAYWKGTKDGLQRTRELLSLLGNPQNELKFVHVAGTNGKGSTCAMLASILQAAGYRTGLYTSPFVNRFNERIALNGTPISDQDLVDVFSRIRPIVDAMPHQPSEFELITSAAMLYYREQRCDVVVLEVGMGGRLDATNAILDEDSVVSAMVNIGFDHMEFLGDTLPLIAGEKAGIIKEKGDVVVYGQSPEVEQVFISKAAEKHATISRSSNEYAIVRHMDVRGTTFDFEGRTGLKISLLGRYQVRNACTAVSDM